MLNNLFAEQSQSRAGPFNCKQVSSYPTQETFNQPSPFFGTQNTQARKPMQPSDNDSSFSMIGFPSEMFSFNPTQNSQVSRAPETRQASNQQKLTQLYLQMKKQFEASCSVFLGKIAAQAKDKGLLKKEENESEVKALCDSIKEAFNDRMAYYKKKQRREAQRRFDLILKIQSHMKSIESRMNDYVKEINQACMARERPKRITARKLKQKIDQLEQENKELTAKLSELRQNYNGLINTEIQQSKVSA